LRFPLSALSLLVLLGSACLPDPARGQAGRLLDELVQAHASLSAASGDVSPTCDLIGGVDTRLTGEPGLVDLRPTWPALRNATADLLAACGQLRLLATPGLDTLAVRQARQRWQQGAAHELTQACQELQSAATSLARQPPPCGMQP
jgi:hypothetical protein